MNCRNKSNINLIFVVNSYNSIKTLFDFYKLIKGILIKRDLRPFDPKRLEIYYNITPTFDSCEDRTVESNSYFI